MLHQIGVGALGPVFRTYEPTRDRLVAVKAFRLDITPEQAHALALELSRAADAGLFHPSIVEPIAAGVEGTVAYRAEEYVAAESLDIAMRHYAPASPDKVLPFITQLAGAIDFARATGVGHGALHPRDIFVTPEEARASGFGVVEALERVGLRAPVRRPYSAPERIDGREWGVAADVFSLAVIAYELFTARRPSGLGAEIGSLSGASIQTHADKLLAVLARAMDADPARRYASALAFAGALEGAARGEAVAVSPPAPVAAIAAAVPAATPAAPPPDFNDDISPERDDDEAHHRWLMREHERAEAESPTLFPQSNDQPLDSEAEADHLLINAAAVAADDSGVLHREGLRSGRPLVSEPELGEEESIEADRDVPRRDFDADYRATTAVVPAQSSRMLPLAAVLSLGLLVGFAVGYGVGARGPGSDEPPVASPAPTQPQSQTAPTTGPAGKAWSEQTVTPQAPAAGEGTSTTPPPVPADANAPTSPPSTAAKPTIATSGRLVVQSTPSRAGVTVNGQWRGRTPLLLEKLPFGAYVVRVVQPGYAVAREDVSLSASEPSRLLSLRLQRQAARETTRAASPTPTAQPRTSQTYSGSMYVDSRPQGARVFLDGRSVGVTPVTIPDVRIGTHVVRLELADHRHWSTTTRVAAGQAVRVTGSLDRIR